MLSLFLDLGYYWRGGAKASFAEDQAQLTRLFKHSLACAIRILVTNATLPRNLGSHTTTFVLLYEVEVLCTPCIARRAVSPRILLPAGNEHYPNVMRTILRLHT